MIFIINFREISFDDSDDKDKNLNLPKVYQYAKKLFLISEINIPNAFPNNTVYF